MPKAETTIVPLDVADEMLSSFGIGADNPEYQRWRRDDGFRLVDLEDVLCKSRLVLGIDWREWLQDATKTILDQLEAIGISAKSDLGEEGESGCIEIEGIVNVSVHWEAILSTALACSQDLTEITVDQEGQTEKAI